MNILELVKPLHRTQEPGTGSSNPGSGCVSHAWLNAHQAPHSLTSLAQAPKLIDQNTFHTHIHIHTQGYTHASGHTPIHAHTVVND